MGWISTQEAREQVRTPLQGSEPRNIISPPQLGRQYSGFLKVTLTRVNRTLSVCIHQAANKGMLLTAKCFAAISFETSSAQPKL
jgi:hypothetical protein